jgi:hypothetical protein
MNFDNNEQLFGKCTGNFAPTRFIIVQKDSNSIRKNILSRLDLNFLILMFHEYLFLPLQSSYPYRRRAFSYQNCDRTKGKFAHCRGSEAAMSISNVG